MTVDSMGGSGDIWMLSILHLVAESGEAIRVRGALKVDASIFKVSSQK